MHRHQSFLNLVICSGLLVGSVSEVRAQGSGVSAPPQAEQPQAEQQIAPAESRALVVEPAQQAVEPAQQAVVATPSTQPPPPAPVGVVLDYTGLSREYRRQQLAEERAGLSLGGPIAVTAIGGVVLVAGGVSYMIGTMIHADCVFDTTCQHKGWLYAGVPLMLVGATVAGLGGIWLGVRSSHRQRLDREIEALATNEGGAGWSMGLVPRPLGATFETRLSF